VVARPATQLKLFCCEHSCTNHRRLRPLTDFYGCIFCVGCCSLSAGPGPQSFRLPMGVGEAFPAVFTANPFRLHCIKTSTLTDLCSAQLPLRASGRQARRGSQRFLIRTDQSPRKCSDPGQRRGPRLLGIMALQPSHNAPGSAGSRDARSRR
jgi:hypothetical protein